MYQIPTITPMKYLHPDIVLTSISTRVADMVELIPREEQMEATYDHQRDKYVYVT